MSTLRTPTMLLALTLAVTAFGALFGVLIAAPAQAHAHDPVCELHDVYSTPLLAPEGCTLTRRSGLVRHLDTEASFEVSGDVLDCGGWSLDRWNPTVDAVIDACAGEDAEVNFAGYEAHARIEVSAPARGVLMVHTRAYGYLSPLAGAYDTATWEALDAASGLAYGETSEDGDDVHVCGL